MSQKQAAIEIMDSSFPAPSTTPIKVINVRNYARARYDDDSACLLAYSCLSSVTTLTSASGYLSGCLLMKLDGAAGIQLFMNQGTLSSCSFVSVL